MYLHAGNNKAVRLKDIVGIFDLDNATVEANTKKYLSMATKKGEVVNIVDEIPKSFIVTGNKKKQTVYISQLSVQTLVGRIENQ